MSTQNIKKMLIGWNEWCALPELGIPLIKTKIDTGAKTSSLHAFNIKSFIKNNRQYISFNIHPLQGSNQIKLNCKALVIDERHVMSSNGHIEHRHVISTPLKLGEYIWPIEITLSNRDPLKFRMLLGREALSGRVIIDPTISLKLGKIKRATLKFLYQSHLDINK